jgi:hypothetical protein
VCVCGGGLLKCARVQSVALMSAPISVVLALESKYDVAA